MRRIALVHDWLYTLGGAERVLLELHAMFPSAPIYTLFADTAFVRTHLADADVRASSLGRIPGISTFYKFLSPLMPAIIESMDLSGYDLVISSSVFFSKGLILKPRTCHLCYCYSPTRPLWDRAVAHEYRGLPSRLSRHIMRIWDRHAAERVDTFIAISEHVKRRIKRYYQRDAEVIYPPVTLAKEPVGSLPSHIPQSYYLIVSRLYRYKNIHIAIDAFNKLSYPLAIVGAGPALRVLKRIAQRNIVFLNEQDDDTIRTLYANCRAFIMPQEEDFGLTAVEAMNFGKPVLALRKGGAVETILEGITGEFFDDPIPEALADGVRRLNENYKNYSSAAICGRAEKFSRKRFHAALTALILSKTHEVITSYGKLQ